MTEKSPCAAVDGLIELVDEYGRFKWNKHSDYAADKAVEIRAYAERLAALATPAGGEGVPVAWIQPETLESFVPDGDDYGTVRREQGAKYSMPLYASPRPSTEGEARKLALEIALDALDEITLAGMTYGMPGVEQEVIDQFHAGRAWDFINMAARAKERARAALRSIPEGEAK